MYTVEELNRGFTIGDWDVLPAQGLLRRGEEEVRPEPKVFGVLMALAKRDGNVVSQDKLIDEVWDGRAFGNEPIQRCIALLRKHFDDQRPFRYIENLPRRGYRLLKPVELHAADGDSLSGVRVVAQSDRRWKAITAFVAIGFVALAAYTYWPRPIDALAVMQFENKTGAAERQYVVDGIQDVLVQRLTGLKDLSDLKDLKIKKIRAPYDDPLKIGRDYLVQRILTGSVREQNGALIVIYDIVDTSDGTVIDSDEIEGHVDDQFALQNQLADAIRKALTGELPPELITRLPPDSVAYDSFMHGMFLLEHRTEVGNLEKSIDAFNKSIDEDESYGPPYLGLATAQVLSPVYLRKEVSTSHDEAIRTIDDGVGKDPMIEAAAGAIYGYVYHQQERWVESEESYRRAVEATVVDSNAFSWYSRMLASVGRLDGALEMALRGKEIDPLSNIVNTRIAGAYTWLGDTEMAHEYFRRATDFKATGEHHVMANTLLLVREHRLDEAQDLAYRFLNQRQAPTYWIEPVFSALADPSLAHEGLAAINRAWDDQHVFADAVFVVRTLLGDLDGAIEFARMLEGPGEVFATELLFIPEMAELRQRPEFMPLLERLRITDYWQQAGCQWENDKVQC
ncbi:MAG TPA: winged helix-turn-helix domain-containing protein [Woeseiaceae bacterium]|jgi:DNA-binding winged helix-turn-helix (wHTH) protein/TolB-like protein|nr:winged helix-turn-helix domain-containing protein [Woeseiaceae bacterium]